MRITAAIVLTHALTGTASVATRYLVEYLDPVDIAFLRYLFGSVCVVCISLAVRRLRILASSDMIKSVLLGVLFFALFPFLFSLAFKYTTAARGALVLATMPMWAMLIGHVTRHETMTPRLTTGVFATVLGLVIALMDKLVQINDSGVSFTGELIMLLTALTGAIYSVLAKSTLKNISAFSYTPIMMASGCLALAPWAVDTHLVNTLGEFSPFQFGVVLYLGCVAGGIAFLLMNWVLNQASATFTTMFVPLNPLTAMFLAWPLLDEPLSVNFMIGSLVVFAGLYIGHTTLKRATAHKG